MKTLSDYREVLADLSEGDESAYAVFFNHYYTQLWPFMLRFTRSEADAEEVLQEVFLRVWLYRDKIAVIENPDAWMYRVASRECLAFLRKRLPDRKRLVCLTDEHDYADLSEMTPADRFDFDEISRAVCLAVERMPARKRKIYQMSRDMGMKPAEIAGALSLSVGTVKNVLSQSLKDIRAFLAKSGFDFMLLILSLLKFF